MGVCNEDLNIRSAPDFLEELAAMATWVGRDDDVFEAGVRVERQIGDEELLGVDGVVEWESWEFHIHAYEDASVGC